MAVEYVRKACDLTEWKQPILVNTLAAAYAELGDFKEAIKWEKKALESSEFEKTYGDHGRHRLKLYEHGKPFRERF